VLERGRLSVESFNIGVGDSASSPLLGRTAQQVYWLFSGTEGIRIASTELLRSIDTDARYSIPASRVESLTVESPLVAVVSVAVPVSIGIGTMLKHLMRLRREWWEGSRAKYESQTAREDVLRLRWERSRREVYGSLDVAQVTREIIDALKTETGQSLQQTAAPMDLDPAINTLTTQAMPALSELVEAGDGSVSFDRRSEHPGV
jgi:hypothetical protein